MKIIDYLQKEIWQVQASKLAKWKAFKIRLLRIILLTSKGFTKSQIQQGASSLTYYSLLAIVPLIALLVGIARGFSFENILHEWLITQFADQKAIIELIYNFAYKSLKEASSGLIAGVGIVVLVWSAIKILTSIEFVMNQIWEVKEGRTLSYRFKDYIALLFLAPVFVFLTSSISGVLSSSIAALNRGEVLKQLTPFLIYFLTLSSFVLIALFFTFLYIYIPNTKVKFLPALIAGLFAGIAYQVLQWIYFYFQIGVSSYNAIYGTFAALPLFLVWLHLSWVIVLLGAKLSFSIQNVDSYEFINDELKLSQQTLSLCALRITHLCIKQFVTDKPPLTASEISKQLSLSLHLTHEIVERLVGINLLIGVECSGKSDECFQPARNIDTLTIKRVLDMINQWGESVPIPPSKESSLILKSLEKFNADLERSEGNTLLKNI